MALKVTGHATSWNCITEKSTAVQLQYRMNFLFWKILYFAHDLWGPSADRREALPYDRKLAEFYNASP